MRYEIWHWLIGLLVMAFLLTSFANHCPAAGVCREVAELVADIEARETDDVMFSFLNAAERAAFAARTRLNTAGDMEVLTARKADPTASVLVAIVRDGCVTSVRFFKPRFFDLPYDST